MRYVLLFLLLLGVKAFAQDNSIKFRNLTIDNGLSQSSVITLLQDSNGFMWIGTQDGLNRYDGNNITVFKPETDNPKSLAHNYITALLEDDQGFIWIGTENGLDKLDPSNGDIFHYSHHQKNPTSISGNNITSLVQDLAGHIWVGTKENGLNRLDPTKGNAVRYKTSNSNLPGNVVNDLMVDQSGNIWIATLSGLSMYNPSDSTFKNYQPEPGEINCLDHPSVWCLSQDSTGMIWIGTSKGINKLYLEDGLALFSHFSLADSANPEVTVSDIYIDRFENVWIGTNENGLYKFFEDQTGASKFYHYHHVHYSASSLPDDQVYCLHYDFSGNIWVGTKGGVSRFDMVKQGFVHLKREYSSQNTLPDNTIWDIFPDGNDVFWIGTKGGLTRFDRVANDFKTYAFSPTNPRRPNNVSNLCFYKDSRGDYWSGTVDGLFKLTFNEEWDIIDRQKIEHKDARSGENDPIVYDVMEDGQGRFWISTREGLSLYNRETGDYSFFRHEAGNSSSLSDNVVRLTHEDRQGRIWVATEEGLNLVTESGGKLRFKRYKNDRRDPASLSKDFITTIWQDEPHILWIGTYGGGLNKFNVQEETFFRIDQASAGLANDVLYGVLGDGEDNLWISSNRGLSKLNKTTLQVTNYDRTDGLQSNEFNTGAYCITSIGEMAFGGINGINFFRPEAIRTNNIAPRVAITAFIVNGSTYMGRENFPLKKAMKVNLSYHQSSFTIDFAALHFSNPENNWYKYKLEGIDNDFTITGSEHRAHYNKLPPGEYVFKVYAANSDGVWSEEPAIVYVTIETPYWKTTWFQVLMFALGISLVYALYRMRIRDIRRQKERLTVLVDEKTEEVMEQKKQIEAQHELLQVEKDKVENLLLNILPEETAEELKQKGKASARQYSRVSVMFTDFKGFTSIAERLKPAELVARLDSYFIEFDKIVEKHNLEKIKTIGDAYMCAGGLPVRNKENPIHTVLAALEIQNYMSSLHQLEEAEGKEHWELRIGINTGETIAGVIGTKRFAYDIWGNAVNVASRLEAACEPGMVNVSGKTFEFIEPYFECTYRGKIPAKNAGEIDVYYVHRIKPELSVNGEGLEPSSAFWDYVNLHLFSSINYMKAERYIMRLLKKKLSPALHYHNIDHVKDVTEAAERIALLEGVKGEDLFLLQTAATYHDAGFVEQYESNEPIGARMAEEILPKFGYTDHQIRIISDLIHVTKIPHDPKNHLEQIICDADLDYLGREDFHVIADKLRVELREHGKIDSDRLWDEIQVKFLTQHKYFTKSAIETRQPGKEKHLEEIKARLAKDEYAD